MKISLDFTGKTLNGVGVKGVFEGSAPKSFKKFTGKEGELFVESGKAATLWVGLGKKEKFTLEKIRKTAAKTLSKTNAEFHENIAFEADSFCGEFSSADAVQALVEGLRLSSYRFDKYKSKPSPSSSIQAVTLRLKTSAQESAIREAFLQAEIISAAVSFTRDLANEPANVMTPIAMAQAAQSMARKSGLKCRVFGKSEIKKMGMGGILAVSQGSSFEPRLVVLENSVGAHGRAPVRGQKPIPGQKPIVLVGKGITFDTGGISIKPSGDMDKMKFDMCGAAAVMGAMKAVAELKLPVKVIGITPICENMPGSKAQRPGDVIKISNGKTVEVLNTDAEGRLILADALFYAKRFSPKALIDIATLTGACAATFSDLASGLMSTDPELVTKIKSAGDKVGERCWELPLWEEYGELIRATFGDIQNISKRNAGTITAGMFLKEFADHTRSWAHLDVAGTAWNNGGAKVLSPIGATGVGVRLFVELIKSYA